MGKLVVRDDLSDPMKAEVILEEVYREVRASYNLREACRVIGTGEALNIEIPLVTQRVSGQQDVPELEEAEISSQAYSHISSKLHKNVVHIALSREAQMEAKQDILSMHVQDAGQEIGRMENAEIADEFSALDSNSGSDWSASNDPFDDIMTAATTVRENGYEPTQLWMEPGVYSALVSNDDILDRLERGATADGQLGTIAGFDIRLDQELPDGEAYLIDPTAPAFVLFDGPEWISEYSSDTAFYDGYIIADFLGLETVLPNAAYRLTDLLG